MGASASQHRCHFKGPVWHGPPEEYSPTKIFHPASPEQQAKGWEQNWNAYQVPDIADNPHEASVQVHSKRVITLNKTIKYTA